MSNDCVPQIAEMAAVHDLLGRALRIFASLLDYPSGWTVDFGMIQTLIDSADDIASVAAFQFAYLKSADDDENVATFMQSSIEIFLAVVERQDLAAVELLSNRVDNIMRYD
jgi:hypothetical protein